MLKLALLILAGTMVVTPRDLSFGDFCKDITEIASCVTECMLIGGMVQPVKSQRDARFLCLPTAVNTTECCSTLRGMVMIKEETPCFPSEYCHETPLSEGSECDYDLQCESLTCLSSQCTAPQNSSQIFNKQIQSRETAVSSTSEVRILSNTSSYYYYSPSTYSSSYYYYTPSTYATNYYYYYASSYYYTPSYYNYTSGNSTVGSATGGIIGGVIGAVFFVIFIIVIVIIVRRVIARNKALANEV